MNRILLIFLLMTVSCDKKFVAPEPDNLIDRAVIEEILYDIKLLKASKSKSYKVLKDNNVQADLYIYEKYEIDSIMLRQNIEYYATKSFKKSKETEEHIRAKFIANKAALEKKEADSIKAKKVKDSIRLPKEKKKEVFKSFTE